jgi:hypothetical protein
MLDGLDKIKRSISVHAELPRGLTAKLMEFMEPFAAMATLRRRLGQEDKPARAAAAAAPLAEAVPMEVQGAAAGPPGPEAASVPATATAVAATPPLPPAAAPPVRHSIHVCVRACVVCWSLCVLERVLERVLTCRFVCLCDSALRPLQRRWRLTWLRCEPACTRAARS